MKKKKKTTTRKGVVVQLNLESVTCFVPYRASYVRTAEKDGESSPVA